MNPIEGLMQQIIRRLGAPTDSQVKDVARSKFVTDTLTPVMRNYGLSRGIRPSDSLEDGVYGQYDGRHNDIAIDTRGGANWKVQGKTPAGTRNLRNTVVHEAAHAATNPKEDFPEYFSVNRPGLWVREDEKAHIGNPGKEASTGQYGVDLRSGKKLNNPDLTLMQALGLSSNKATQSELDAFRNLDWYYTQGKQARFGGGYTDYEGESFAQAMTNAMGFLDENSKSVQPNYRERIGQLEGNTPGAGQLVRDLLSKPIYANHPLKTVIR